jgi:transposase-like protein
MEHYANIGSEAKMDTGSFRRLCAGVERMTVEQIRALREKLRALDARIEVLARIDARGDGLDRCLHCGGGALQRWGSTRTGLRRQRCKGCGRTFSSATGTALARVRLPEKVLQVVEDMLGPNPGSCRALAARLGLDKMTVWRWRMRILAALTGVGARAITGIVEADEKFFRESRKGSREWVKHERNPSLHPKPDRPRWRDFQRLGLLRPAGVSKWQVPVLTVTDRAGARRADVLPDRRAESLVALLEAHVGRDAVLCSDGDGAYDLFARRRAMPHYRLHPKTGPKVIDTAFHIQTVNNLHSRFESFMKPFCSPTTRNLPGYAAWFITRLVGSPADARDAAWQRLLAA